MDSSVFLQNCPMKLGQLSLAATKSNGKMISRLLVAASICLSISACSDDFTKGKEIFARECANCHSMINTMERLEDVNLEERPAYLSELLKSHPVILNDVDKNLVIDLLSRPNN